MSSVCLATGMSGESGAAILMQDCVTTCFCLSSFSPITGLVKCFQWICSLASLCHISLGYWQEFSVYFSYYVTSCFYLSCFCQVEIAKCSQYIFFTCSFQLFLFVFSIHNFQTIICFQFNLLFFKVINLFIVKTL